MEFIQEYEQEIDLKDLLFHILYKWKIVMTVLVLFCGLVVGYVALYNGKMLPDKRTYVGEKLEEQRRLLDALAEGQSADPIQKQITQLQEEINDLKEYSYVKYGVMGLGGGLFLIVFIYAVGYACSDKLRGERELRERYGYYLLGTIPKERRGLNRFLEKLEGVSEQVSEEEAYWIISTNIANLVDAGLTILVTGTVDEAKLNILTEILSSQLENISLMPGANMNVTASTLETLAMCDMVILVEERDKSLRAKVQKEQESIVMLNKMVLGYVVI